MVSLAIALCLHLCPVCCPAQTAGNGESPASISGVILDPDGQPVRGAEVWVWWYYWPNPWWSGPIREWGGGDLRTGPAGEFALYDVPPGFVRLGASMPDMLPVYTTETDEPLRIERARPANGVVLRSPGYGATVTGTVMNELGRPVANAVVSASGWDYGHDVAQALEQYGRFGDSTRTGLDGRFRLAHVRPGDRAIWAFARGWAPAGSTLELAERGEVSATLVLKRCRPGTWTLVGRVIDEHGASVVGAGIVVNYELEPGQSSAHPRKFATTSTGGFLAYGLPPSKPVRVCAYHPSVGVWQAELRGREGEYRRTTIELNRGSKLRGVVSSADGTPLANQEIPLELAGSAVPEGHSPMYNLNLATDERGSYVLAGLRPGGLELELKLDRRKRQIREELVIKRPHTRHDIVIPSPAAVSGRVIGPEGRPVREAWVVLQREGGLRYGPLWTPDGYFRCEPMDPGQCTVAAWARGFWTATANINLPEGERVTALHLRLGDGPAVSGVVVDADGQPLPGVAVRLAPGSTKWEDDPDPLDREEWLRRRQKRPPLTQTLAEYTRLDGLATTEVDGSFAIRGVSALTIGLVAGEPGYHAWQSAYGFWQQGSEPVQPVKVQQRHGDGTYVAGGGVLVSLREARDVTGVVIRVAKAVPDEDLCHVRGIVRDPAHQFASLDGLTVVLGPSPLGSGRDIGPGQRLHRTGHDHAALGGDGAFEVRNVPPREHMVLVGDEDNTYQLAHVELKPGDTVDLGELPVPVAGAVEGSVSNADGQPIGEGTVLASRRESRLYFSDASREHWEGGRQSIEADGTYRFGELGAGFWYLMAVCPSEPAAGIKRIFVNGGKQRLDFRHRYSGRSVGRMTDTEGKPVAKARIDCSGKTLKERLKTETDEEGRFEIGGLPEGAYTVKPRYQWCLRASATAVRVDESAAPAAVEFIVELGGSIEGLLLGADGQPVRDAAGEFEAQAGPPWIEEPSAWLMEDGRIVSGVLKPGTYLLRVRGKSAGEDVPWLESEPVGVYAGRATKGAVIELPRR